MSAARTAFSCARPRSRGAGPRGAARRVLAASRGDERRGARLHPRGRGPGRRRRPDGPGDRWHGPEDAPLGRAGHGRRRGDRAAEGAVRVVVDADAAGAVEALPALGAGGWASIASTTPSSSRPPTPPGCARMIGPRRHARPPGGALVAGPVRRRGPGRTRGEARRRAHCARRAPCRTGSGERAVVQTPAVVTLGVDDTAIASIALALRGRALAFTFAKAAVDALAAERAAHPGERVVLARDRTHLATLPIDEAAATPPRGLVLATTLRLTRAPRTCAPSSRRPRCPRSGARPSRASPPTTRSPRRAPSSRSCCRSGGSSSCGGSIARAPSRCGSSSRPSPSAACRSSLRAWSRPATPPRRPGSTRR